MIKLLITLLLLTLPVQAQTISTIDVLPDNKSADSLTILNNDLRKNQNAINAIGAYFNSSGCLEAAAGGTGSCLSSHTIGNLYYDDGTNFFATLGAGTLGYVLTSNGPGVAPSYQTIGASHGLQLFITSGTFTAPTGTTKVYLTMVGAGGAGKDSGGATVKGAGGGAAVISYPYNVVASNAYAVTVGTGGVHSATPTDGGATSFDSTVSAPGGLSTTNGGTGGAGGYNATTSAGGTYRIAGGNSSANGDGGGGTPFGTGGAFANASPGGTPTANSGAGGASGDTGLNGSNGADGFLLVQW